MAKQKKRHLYKMMRKKLNQKKLANVKIQEKIQKKKKLKNLDKKQISDKKTPDILLILGWLSEREGEQKTTSQKRVVTEKQQ